ncbi:F-box associated domain, type 1 [Artemisia annua]|uniref:F-box associated domain, type 1 n=1 Tax=Artemisia annua TaxID=35608 RepID=A0A2U1LAK9_ARTAN|nr:F-box associated domain, type 1 [Artemisia annua]
MEDLGENFVWDIFSRLDFKTVIYCKCVCKKWRDLVLDPYFVNKLWSKNQKDMSLMIHGYDFSREIIPGSLTWVRVQEDDDADDYHVDNITSLHLSDVRPIMPVPWMATMGSVNGLICMMTLNGSGPVCNTVYIFNLVFEEYIALPEPQSVYSSYILLHYGFGVSVVGEEYKVIRIYRKRVKEVSTDSGDPPSHDPPEIEVYTLGTDHWRPLGPVPYSYERLCPLLNRSSIFFRGRVHWIFFYGGIYGFDLDDETFQYVFQSPPSRDEYYKILGVLKGRLCQFTWSSCGEYTLWVMKEYGINDSWYKEVTVAQSLIPDVYSYWVPLCLIDGPSNGSILIFSHGSVFLAYHLDTNVILQTNMMRLFYTKTSIPYRPSFLKLSNFGAHRVHAFNREVLLEVRAEWMDLTRTRHVGEHQESFQVKELASYHKITSSFNPCIKDLPENVMADVISRLPVKTIIHCKSVCKNWRELVSDSYFINLHLSRSPRCVMIHHKIQPDLVSESDSEDEDETVNLVRPGVLKCLEIKGELDTSHLHHDIVMSLDLNITPIFNKNTKILQVGSVNGLVCLSQYRDEVDNIYVCNPITREYVILPRPQYVGLIPVINTFSFGVGLLTKEYKVVLIFLGSISQNPTSSLPYLLQAEVCTLGTGQWRRIGHVPYWINASNGLFLNGCVHWIVNDKHSPERLCSFNIDNETFELFPSPPSEEIVGDFCYRNLGILNGCLSLSDHPSLLELEFTIWVMKEYGFKKSWCKEVVIKRSMMPNVGRFLPVYLIESLDDGSILMFVDESSLLLYCPRKKTIEKRDFFKPYFTGKAYRPSFLKLETFQPQRVLVF